MTADSTHVSTESTLVEIVKLEKLFPVKKGVFSRVVAHVHAMDGIDLSIKKGETLGLVGESGCGKTTVGRALLMLIPPTGGYTFFETPKSVVDNFKVLVSVRDSIKLGKMTSSDALRVADALSTLFSSGECDIADDKKKHLCKDADKIRESASRLATMSDRMKHEDDIRKVIESAILEVARKYCINYKDKSRLKAQGPGCRSSSRTHTPVSTQDSRSRGSSAKGSGYTARRSP